MPVDAHGHFVNKDKLCAGDLVIWTCNKDLRGSIGLVRNYYAQLATCAFPEGEWNFRVETLRKLNEGDTMRYKGKRPEIPSDKGCFGLIAKIHATGLISVQYEIETELKKNTVVKYIGNVEGVPKDEFGMVCGQTGDGFVLQYQTRKWENLPVEDLRLEFEVPYVALQYIDVKTALTAQFRNEDTSKPGTAIAN